MVCCAAAIAVREARHSSMAFFNASLAPSG